MCLQEAGLQPEKASLKAETWQQKLAKVTYYVAASSFLSQQFRHLEAILVPLQKLHLQEVVDFCISGHI